MCHVMLCRCPSIGGTVHMSSGYRTSNSPPTAELTPRPLSGGSPTLFGSSAAIQVLTQHLELLKANSARQPLLHATPPHLQRCLHHALRNLWLQPQAQLAGQVTDALQHRQHQQQQQQQQQQLAAVSYTVVPPPLQHAEQRGPTPRQRGPATRQGHQLPGGPGRGGAARGARTVPVDLGHLH